MIDEVTAPYTIFGGKSYLPTGGPWGSPVGVSGAIAARPYQPDHAAGRGPRRTGARMPGGPGS
ncbi:hypothetical protein GCM10010335_42150 [Streptomyces galbus]|nr:hypothetical protein GCM10010335_42150 [Streptomyces galbus]